MLRCCLATPESLQMPTPWHCNTSLSIQGTQRHQVAAKHQQRATIPSALSCKHASSLAFYEDPAPLPNFARHSTACIPTACCACALTQSAPQNGAAGSSAIDPRYSALTRARNEAATKKRTMQVSHTFPASIRLIRASINQLDMHCCRFNALSGHSCGS